MLGDDGEERIGIADAGDDGVPGVLEQAGEALTEKTASSAITIRMGSPPRRASRSPAGSRSPTSPMRGDAVSEACKTRSAADDRTADAVVRDR